MGFRPPKGVRPPQLEGRRTGRPKGSRNFASAWRDVEWGYEHRYDPAKAPTAGARLWQSMAGWFPDEVEAWLEEEGRLPKGKKPDGIEALLADMRWVFRHDEVCDTTEAHRHCRELLERNSRGFWSQMLRLEQAVARLKQGRRK